VATLCFGGSFNPIHHAHLICARAVAEGHGDDKILLIPTGQPPHKADSTDIVAQSDRIAMCRLAVAGSTLFEVSDIEFKRDGPSYTIDTARELTRLSGQKINWLIGADMLLYLPKWHQIDQLLQEVAFVVMARPGSVIDWEALPPQFRSLRQNVVQAPLIDISASGIRKRVGAGRSIDYLTPEPVCRYIRDRGLYR
jgi:nicotinate-nucleotide adenylyltransferase